MEITEQEKQLAYSLLSDVSKSTNKEREIELRGILKGILAKKHNNKTLIRNAEFSFSGGKIEILP